MSLAFLLPKLYMAILYHYHDFETAYYKYQYNNCIMIGLYLLEKFTDKYSRKLYFKLKNFNYNWQLSQTKKEEFAKLLQEVKN